MKKVKKFASALLAMAMVFSLLAVSASAAVPPTDSGISVCTATQTTTVSLDVPSTSYMISLPIAGGYNYWKLQFQTSNPRLRFYIAKDRPDGEIVYEPDWDSIGGYLPTGNSPFYGRLDAGNYYITVYVAGGATNLQGVLWYKTAITEAEVKS